MHVFNHNITIIVILEIEVILYTVDDTTFGKSVVFVYGTIILSLSNFRGG
jgi:hypothetical protein